MVAHAYIVKVPNLKACAPPHFPPWPLHCYSGRFGGRLAHSAAMG